jgi:undecaprenyl-diphosphatase
MPKIASFLLSLDERILLYVQNRIRRPRWNLWMQIISGLGNGGFLWLACGAFLLLTHTYRMLGISLICAQAVGVLITNFLIKPIVARTRPFRKLKALHPLIKPPTDWSFPSGHTTSSVSASVILFLGLPYYVGIPMLLIGILIAFSRMYVGVHYPSDILGGIVVGAFAAWAGTMLTTYANLHLLGGI